MYQTAQQKYITANAVNMWFQAERENVLIRGVTVSCSRRTLLCGVRINPKMKDNNALEEVVEENGK
jgi:hypothetical protein